MIELRLTIINNDPDPMQDKRVELHVTDAEKVLGDAIAGKGPLAAGAQEINQIISNVLAKASDTDKIEIDPAKSLHHKADGSAPAKFSLL